MINKGHTDASIQNDDREKVKEVESFMKRVTLSRNKLQYYKDCGIPPLEHNELRVVLIGKVSEHNETESVVTYSQAVIKMTCRPSAWQIILTS